MINASVVTEFILMGFSDNPKDKITLFVVFLLMYFITLGGSLLIIVLTVSDARLHNPMYFLLSNLSFVDMCSTSTTMPKMLVGLLSGNKTISFPFCITQLFFFVTFATTGIFLLVSMAYDRYVAICNPLHYTLVMAKWTCFTLVAVSWTISSLHSLLHSIMVSVLRYCGPNIIPNFFCDIPPLLKLSCSDTSVIEVAIFVEGSVIAMASVFPIILSYFRIISTILKISSGEGRWKTFSTCSSHLTAVTLYLGTAIFTYIKPSSSYSLDKSGIITVMYTIVTPMLNPFIYSLRNNDVKRALRKMLSQKKLWK
ncbi:olfactory receptor 1361-like [Spea bombifrons]|uniref:olfactory receptor 1361-like n=1 Tax=Spea bombifrons TaxID=233779 RepID=UPI0023498B09|nr:olfactory receptor 1361-like [Spea bombifrons]